MAELILDSVSQSYAQRQIIADLSFTLPEGAIGCLLGPSGCGKTTALRCISGFEPIQTGAIRIGGEVVSRPDWMLAAEKRRVGMVFQDYALFPHLTVAANIGFGLRREARQSRQARVDVLLELVGLAGHADQYPHQLSGGQQQRVALARALAPRLSMAVITNDIYTREDAEFLMRAQVLPAGRIRGVETGGCPHTAIREDASINLAAVDELTAAFPDLDLIVIESGGDNLAATFSPELADLTIYVIDTAAGQDIPRKRGPGLTKSDLLVVNKTDLAPHVGVDLVLLEADTARARGPRPYVMAELREGRGVGAITEFLLRDGGLTPG